MFQNSKVSFFLLISSALLILTLVAGLYLASSQRYKESDKNILIKELTLDTLSEKINKEERIDLKTLEIIRDTYSIPGIGVCSNKLEAITATGILINKDFCSSKKYLADKSITIERANLTLSKSRQNFTVVFAFEKRISESLPFRLFEFIAFLIVGILIVAALGTVFLTRLTRKSSVELVQMLIRNRGKSGNVRDQMSPEFIPVLKEVRTLVRELESDKKLRDATQIHWDSKSLKEVLTSRLKGDQVLVVANRQPYIHNYSKEDPSKIQLQVPASGLVTALEPVMRACSGMWFAHGSGTADKAVVDDEDKIWVPPEEKVYQIKRIWLTEEEEKGFYYGFANEGLWPLCHIAHIRPVFRMSDFEAYRTVNEKFANAIHEEAHREDPIILVQDYHFALLPRMIKERLPKATVITFWHIPWPNPEKFGICPWVEELLDGMLGSSILGFHTKYHCQNFLETVDRFCESRINWGQSTISYQGELSAIRRYPISIEFPPKALGSVAPVDQCKETIYKKHKIPQDVLIGLGVERLDYTKGIIERFLAIETFLDKHPECIDRFTFIQIAAPSRSTLTSYRQFTEEVETLVERINGKFNASKVPPITLLIEHKNQDEIFEYFRAASFCMVMSLHDGMNLVAKEFIASRDDLQGSLILSLFAGAAKEFPEALIVNPYDIEQTAEALHTALSMEPQEQRQRMRSMREHIREHNVYRWAGNMLLDAVKLRDRNRLLDRLSEYSPTPGYWE